MARVLLVEYDKILRESIAVILEWERALEVIGEAGSVAECRSFLSRGQGFDVAVVDLSLPDGDTVELIEDLRKANPNASVVVLSISSDLHDHVPARAAGADEVVSMASSIEQLLETVRRLARP